MPNQPSPRAPGPADLEARLHALARLLREGGTLSPDARQSLAALVDELAAELRALSPPPPEAAHLADGVAHLLETLRHPHNPTLLGAARERLEQTAVAAEVDAPVATDIVRRLLEALANIGI